MEVQGSVSKVRQQPVNVQSMHAINASRPGISMGSRPLKTPPATMTFLLQPKTPSSATKFSNDIERLQQINRIRNSPAGAQIKRVIKLLLETREAFTSERIYEACYVDIKGNKDVFDLLIDNVKVKCDGKYYSYKPTHDLQNKDELLKLIRKFPDGIATKELEDAYPKVMEDLKVLRADGQIWLLSNLDSQDFAHPNDPKLVSLKVDDDLKQFFRGIELPRDMIDIEKDLRKNKIPPVTDTANRRKMAQVPGVATEDENRRNRRRRNPRNLTNYHLPELLADLNG